MIKSKNLDFSVSGSASTQGYSHGLKLLKDDKSVIEELTTARNEFKKVNQFLIDEIESLKNENIYLKSELSKYVLNCSEETTTNTSNSVNISNMNDSFSKNDESSSSTTTLTSATNVEKKMNDKERSLDLTKYIDSEDDNDEEDDDNTNLPPFEFTVDS